MTTYKTQLSNGSKIEVKESDVLSFAQAAGLNELSAGRYSTLFAFKLFLYTTFEGVEMHSIVEEINALEGLADRALATKSPTQFTQLPLKGLWHQHFFSAHFVPQNIAAQLNKKKLSALVDRIMDPAKSLVITPEMIDELSRAATLETFEEREAQSKLTGEWIVFAKHQGQNYYLTLAVHPEDRSGDQKIFDEISRMAYKQFPFLAST